MSAWNQYNVSAWDQYNVSAWDQYNVSAWDQYNVSAWVELKRTNNDLQNTTQKAEKRARQPPLKIGGELSYSGRVISSCSTSGTRRVTLVTR